MKMAAVSEITLLLLGCSILFFTGVQSSCNAYAAKGETYVVVLGHQLQKSDILKWKHRNKVIVERKSNFKFSLGSEDDIYQNGSLKLRNVNANHSGNYEPVVFTEHGVRIPNLKSVDLCVLDPVPEPEVTHDCMSIKQVSKVKFTCTVAQKNDIKFEWLQNNKLLHQGPTLTLDIKDTGSLSCRVFNNASAKFSKPVTHSCHQSIIPETVFGISIWIFVGTGAGVVVLLMFVVIICCVQVRRRKRKLQILEEEDLRLRSTNCDKQQQQGHVHHHTNNPNRPHNHHLHHNQRQPYHQPTGRPAPRQPHPKQRPSRAPDPPYAGPQSSPRRSAQANTPANTGSDQLHPPLPQPRRKSPRTPRVREL